MTSSLNASVLLKFADRLGMRTDLTGSRATDFVWLLRQAGGAADQAQGKASGAASSAQGALDQGIGSAKAQHAMLRAQPRAQLAM